MCKHMHACVCSSVRTGTCTCLHAGSWTCSRPEPPNWPPDRDYWPENRIIGHQFRGSPSFLGKILIPRPNPLHMQQQLERGRGLGVGVRWSLKLLTSLPNPTSEVVLQHKSWINIDININRNSSVVALNINIIFMTWLMRTWNPKHTHPAPLGEVFLLPRRATHE